jgi:hypothetical protein
MTDALTWLLVITTTIIIDPAPGPNKKTPPVATSTTTQMVTEAQCRSMMSLFKGPQTTAICVAPNGEFAEREQTDEKKAP